MRNIDDILQSQERNNEDAKTVGQELKHLLTEDDYSSDEEIEEEIVLTDDRELVEDRNVDEDKMVILAMTAVHEMKEITSPPGDIYKQEKVENKKDNTTEEAMVVKEPSNSEKIIPSKTSPMKKNDALPARKSSSIAIDADYRYIFLGYEFKDPLPSETAEYLLLPKVSTRRYIVANELVASAHLVGTLKVNTRHSIDAIAAFHGRLLEAQKKRGARAVKSGEYLYALPMGISKLGKSNAFQTTMLLLGNNFLFMRLLLPFIDKSNQKDMFFLPKDSKTEFPPSPMLLEMLLLLHYGRFGTFQVYSTLLQAVAIDPNEKRTVSDILVHNVLGKLGPAFQQLYAEDWFALKVTDQGRCTNCANATVTKLQTIYQVTIDAREATPEGSFQTYIDSTLNEPPTALDGLKDKCKCCNRQHVFNRCITMYPKFLLLNIRYDENVVKDIGFNDAIELKSNKVITTQQKDGAKYKYGYQQEVVANYILSGIVTTTNSLAHIVYVRDLLANIWLRIKDEQVTVVNGDLPKAPKYLIYTQTKCLVDEIEEWSRVSYSHINPYIYNMLNTKKSTEQDEKQG